MSILAGADIVLLRRGEVRRGRDGPKTSLMLFFLPGAGEADDAEFAEAVEAFDDIDVNGGRVVVDVTGCCSLAAAFRENRVVSEGIGEGSVKSSDSTSSDGCRSCIGAGAGAPIDDRVAPRCLVGVTDARHASKVACFGTEVSLAALVVAVSLAFRVFAFLAGNCEGEGCAGESTKSRVSIVFGSGGVEGLPSSALISAGSVFER